MQPTGERIAEIYARTRPAHAFSHRRTEPRSGGRHGVSVRHAGLELVDTLTSEPALQGYHLLPSVRGDLLVKLGRFDEARAEFERAAALTRNARERQLLLDRASSPHPDNV